MKAKVFGLSLALALLGAAPARAQQAPAQPPAPAAKADDKLPTAEAVFDQYLAAIGGEAALGKFKSRVSRGTLELAPMGAKGTFVISQKAPDSYATTMNLAGLGTMQQVYDGAAGWSKDPFTGLRELKGAELAALQRGAHLNPAGWRKAYASMKVTGRAKVGEREAYVVEGAHAHGTPDKLYFDAQTGLLLRLDSVVEGPQGRAVAETTFEDYREVDGVKLPHTTRAAFGPATMIIRIEEINHDVPVEDKLFAKPAP